MVVVFLGQSITRANMSDASPPLSEAAQAVADSKIPPGDEYEEIREQVRKFFTDGIIVASWELELT